ncbi:hypothetical protein HGRIS_008680 [Hohenbuehelia grisea]|uniref:Uncharacterized protein n=1 Tax=Hohenbuehelia grisea TaxID=104357 RepID=A0ABR3J8N0_9AGAR
MLTQTTKRLEADPAAFQRANVRLAIVLRARKMLIQGTEPSEFVVAEIALEHVSIPCAEAGEMARFNIARGDEASGVGDEVVLVVVPDQPVDTCAGEALRTRPGFEVQNKGEGRLKVHSAGWTGTRMKFRAPVIPPVLRNNILEVNSPVMEISIRLT